MSNASELVFGLILWLTSCSVILSLYGQKSKFQSLPKSSKSDQFNQEKSLEKNNLLSDENAIHSEIQDKNWEKLEKELEIKNKQLEAAQTRIYFLLEEIENTSNELELMQNKSSKTEAKLKKEYQGQISDLENKIKLTKDIFQKQLKQLKIDFQDMTIESLYSLLTNYPTAKIMTKVKPDLPAKNLVNLFKPLDHLLSEWGIDSIGKPWEKVPYNPQLHQPDTNNIKEGEMVYIRFVGYRDGERILYPAKVSKTLPGKSKSST